MKELLRETVAYTSIAKDVECGTAVQTELVLFPDAKYLRMLLKECAKLYFFAGEGSRISALIEKESFSDCIMFPTEGAKLTAEDGARIVEESLLQPVESAKKLIVIDGFHTVTPLVQNKLLKVLEEPPQNVYFLLGAAAEFPVLPTVRSRAKKLSVPPFSEEQIARALRRSGSTEGVKEAAAASGGIYSVAESLISDGGEEFRLAERFLKIPPALFVREIGDYKEKRAFFSALSLLLRDMLFFREGKGRFASLKQAEALSGEYETGALLKGLELVREAEKQIQFNANFAQCVYALAVALQEEKRKWQRLS